MPWYKIAHFDERMTKSISKMIFSFMTAPDFISKLREEYKNEIHIPPTTYDEFPDAQISDEAEKDAYVRQFYLASKKEKRPFYDVMKSHFDIVKDDLISRGFEDQVVEYYFNRIMTMYAAYALRNFPKAQL